MYAGLAAHAISKLKTARKEPTKPSFSPRTPPMVETETRLPSHQPEKISPLLVSKPGISWCREGGASHAVGPTTRYSFFLNGKNQAA
jgi:hypothetical protein